MCPNTIANLSQIETHITEAYIGIKFKDPLSLR